MSEDGNALSKVEAELLKEGIKTLDKASVWFGRVFGSVFEDLVGLVVGDRLRIRRMENIIELMKEVDERLSGRSFEKLEPAPLALAIPILEAAADESRKELRDLWARLLAAASDPARVNQVRQMFIETVKKLDPLDAVVFQILQQYPKGDPNLQTLLSPFVKATPNEVELSLENLISLGLIWSHHRGAHIIEISIETKGREFLRLLRD